jgi:hypothetical protein
MPAQTATRKRIAMEQQTASGATPHQPANTAGIIAVNHATTAILMSNAVQVPSTASGMPDTAIKSTHATKAVHPA